MTVSLALLAVLALLAPIALTSGHAGYERGPEPSASEAAALAERDGADLDCDTLELGGRLRASAEATGCSHADVGELVLVARCAVTGVEKRSPVAHGTALDSHFATLPCAFGLSEAYFELDGARAQLALG